MEGGVLSMPLLRRVPSSWLPGLGGGTEQTKEDSKQNDNFSPGRVPIFGLVPD
jgi:hypothetical protein